MFERLYLVPDLKELSTSAGVDVIVGFRDALSAAITDLV